jgi:hypothetical protein
MQFGTRARARARSRLQDDEGQKRELATRWWSTYLELMLMLMLMLMGSFETSMLDGYATIESYVRINLQSRRRGRA